MKMNIKNIIVCATILAGIFLWGFRSANQPEDITVFFDQKGASVSPDMYGVFFEEINHAGDGGLYAELVNNRSFEELEMPQGYYAKNNNVFPAPVQNHITGEVKREKFRWTTEPVPAWYLKSQTRSSALMKLTKENPKFHTAPNNLKVSIPVGSGPVLLINKGYWGMNLIKGDNYFFRTIIKPAADYKGIVNIVLLSEKENVIKRHPLIISEVGLWNDISVTVSPDQTDAKGKLALEFEGSGSVYVDYVSLFPEKTFKNRPNGLRNDVAQMIAGLKPAFVRWPGGCVVEGISLPNRFEWKKTLGDPAARAGEYSTWGYRCSYGFGYYEMLQYCEDMNTDAMFVCNVGIGCQFRMGDACSNDSIGYYLDDCLDAIEYAIGDVKTEWGGKRAASGHPDPFPLKYIEVGNENWGDEYDRRFDIFYKAIKIKYPQLTIISNHGLNGAEKINKTDMIDPHWYANPFFFYSNTNIFDQYPRGKYNIYVGEYACNSDVGTGNMTAALSEAAFITGMERNGDLVTMTSYAPLLENSNDRNWSVNLIWMNSKAVLGRSSYYVQKLMAENRPDYNVKISQTMSVPQKEKYESGRFGFGTWSTQAEFKNITVTQAGRSKHIAINQSSEKRGKWNWAGNTLSQLSAEQATKYVVDEFKGNNYMLEFDVKKTGGLEGFFLYYGLSDDGRKGFMYNVGGWNNSKTVVERIVNGRNGGIDQKEVPQSLRTDKWYHVKLIVTPQKSHLYMNGVEVLSHVPYTIPMQFFSSGVDAKAGELVLKVVNGSAADYYAAFNLDGVKEIDGSGKIITLAAANGQEENSFENPDKIIPREILYKKLGKRFEYTFAPYSLTIIRLKAK